jgi:plasmid stabilization system protein ParE
VSGYILGQDADLDLDDIWEYIARDDVDAADRWIEKLFDAFEALAQNPGMGHKREDLTGYPVLFWPVGAYLIIYRAERTPLETIAVTQGSRDIPAFLHRRMH